MSQVFPQQMPDINQFLVIIIGLLALIAVVREPESPTSLVDSRRKTPISQDRLHAGRGLIGVLVFVAAFLAGPAAAAMGPAVIALILVLISNEMERDPTTSLVVCRTNGVRVSPRHRRSNRRDAQRRRTHRCVEAENTASGVEGRRDPAIICKTGH